MRKSTTRILTITLSVILTAALLLCACGKSSDSSLATDEPEASISETTEETSSAETKDPKKSTKETTTAKQTETTSQTTTETTTETIEESENQADNQAEAGGSGDDQNTQDQQSTQASSDSGNSSGASSQPASSGYSIDVNLSYGCVTIYYDGSPVRAMRCSVGTGGANETVVGTFSIGGGAEWMYMEGNVWAQYATRFYGPYLFHSVPYYSRSNSDLEYDDYNKLGSPASLGCVRLSVADARWIYYNMPYGTPVRTFYDSSSPGPLGKPGGYWIPTDIKELRGWDPTDPAGGNPWPSYYVDITAPDITINAGEGGIFSKVSVTDRYGNDVSNYAEYSSGSVDTSTPGTYTAYVSVSIGGYYYDEKAFTVTVAGSSEPEPAQTEPAPTEPAPTEPEQTEPEQTEPEQTEPQQTEPAPSEPESADPVQTEA